jgi:hypothetical protein
LIDYNEKNIGKRKEKMKKSSLIIAAMLSAASVWSGSLPGRPVSSSYIGKRWAAFELNNGPSYKWKKLPDGSSIQYWRSDLARCCIGRADDGWGNRCALVRSPSSRQRRTTDELTASPSSNSGGEMRSAIERSGIA